MNPFSNQISKDSNQRNNPPQTNPNFLNFFSPYTNSIPEEDEVQMLLDTDSRWQSEQKTLQRPKYEAPSPKNLTNQQQDQRLIGFQINQIYQPQLFQQNQPASLFDPNQQNSFNMFINPPHEIQPRFEQNFGVSNDQIPSNIAPPKKRANIERVSKLDEDIMRLIRENDENFLKPQIDDAGSKAPSKIEQKNNKAVSRLSQHIFAKSGNSEEQMKSKRKNRHTIAAFGIQNQKDWEVSKDEIETQRNPDRNLDKLLSMISQVKKGQPEKMEVESINQEKENFIFFANSPSKQQPKELDPNLKHAENRLSEVKKKRQRLSFGMDGIQNLMRIIEKDEKEKEIQNQPQPVKKINNRITMDFSEFMNFLESTNKDLSPIKSVKDTRPNIVQDEKPKEEKEEKEEKEKKEEKENASTSQVTEILKHLTEYTKPVIKIAEEVIHEDEKEDDFTPIKSKQIPHQLSIKKLDLNFRQSRRKSLADLLPKSKSKFPPKENYTRQVFNLLFCDLKGKIETQKRKCEQLTQEKAQLIKEINNRMSEFTINEQKLSQLKKMEHEIRAHIYSIKQKVDKVHYQRSCQYMNQFELKLGIQFHKVARVQTDGFYVEFTYDDILCRIQRNDKPSEIKIKVMHRIVDKRVKKDFEFGFEERKELIQAFILRKLKNVKRFIPFMMGLVGYVRALRKFELSIVQFAYTTNMSNLQITQKKTEMEFYVKVGSKFEFLFMVDLMELLNSGGITIFSVYDGKNLEIPEEFLTDNEKGNKLGKTIIFMEKYVTKLMKQQIENALKIK